MKRLVLITLAAFCYAACGSPPPTTSGNGPGEPCTADAQCQGGLECHAAQCDFTRCDDSTSPQDFCARRLDVPASITRCDGGECVVERSAPGGSCSVDQECTFGSACVRSICTLTCRVDASCPDPSTRCLPRSDSPGDVLHCQDVPTCDLAQSPSAFCAEALELEPALVLCDEGSCRALEPPGELGEPCSPDFGCVQDLRCSLDVCSERGGVDDPCAVDADCDSTSICLEGSCARGCAEGCGADEACFPRPGDSIGYCDEVDPLDCRTYPDPDARCANLSPASACNTDGSCSVSETFDFVRLSYAPTTAEYCEERTISGLDAPGPIISGVEFVRDDEVVSHALVIESYGGGYDNHCNEFDLFGVGFDGHPLPFDETGCPILTPSLDMRARAFAVGCDQAFVDLIPSDSDRRPVSTQDVALLSNAIRVRLYDELSCSDEPTLSPLLPDVSLCQRLMVEGEPSTSCRLLPLTSRTTEGILATF